MAVDEVEVYNGADRPVAVPAEIVLAAQREYRAYQDHQNGLSWAEIAEKENWPSAAAAQSAVRRYLAEGEVLVERWTKAEMLSIHIATLRRLKAKAMEGAMEGRLPAIAMVRDLIMDEIKLLRLDEEVGTGGVRTVVVSGDEKTYTARLVEVAATD